MDKSTLNTLARKAHINNEVKRCALIEVKNILPQLPQYINKKIFTGKNTKTKIFNINFLETLPLPFDAGNIMLQHAYLINNRNALTFCVSYCFSGGNYSDRSYYCDYERLEIEIGSIDKDLKLFEVLPLEKIISFNCLDHIINLPEELEKIQKYLILEKEAKEAKRLIKFNYDLYKYLLS